MWRHALYHSLFFGWWHYRSQRSSLQQWVRLSQWHFDSGCHPYPMLLKRQKMLKNTGPMYQPGQTPLVQEYFTHADFYPDKSWEVYSRSFAIMGVDEFTQEFFEKLYARKFPLSSLEPPKPGEPMRILPSIKSNSTRNTSLQWIWRWEGFARIRVQTGS